MKDLNDLYIYAMSNANFKHDLEREFLREYIFSMNESFIPLVFEELIKEKNINLRIIKEVYENLLNEEALKKARTSKIVFKNEDIRYKYDCLNLLRIFYFNAYKTKKLKRN